MSIAPSSPAVPAAEMGTPSVKVWDLPTRVFHWSLALSFAGAYLTSEGDSTRGIHMMFGYTLLGLIAFRILWGFVGTRYARFSSFLFSPGRILAFIRGHFSGTREHFLGHNPAGSVAIFLLLGLGAATALAGYATYQELGGEWLEDLHEVLANTMLAVVGVHIAGVILSSILDKENLARSMITGRKRGSEEQGIASARKPFGVALLLCVLGFWAYASGTQVFDQGGEGKTAQHEQDHDDDD